MSIFKSRTSASSNQAAGLTVVAVFANQCELIASVIHLPSSAHVRERSCCSVFAVTMMVEPSLVDNIQRINHETKADLPIPRPEATASLNISGSTLPLFLCICVVIFRKIFSCHFLGPEKCSRGVSFCPQGNTNLTKLSGSSLIPSDQISVISSFSASAPYFIKKLSH